MVSQIWKHLWPEYFNLNQNKLLVNFIPSDQHYGMFKYWISSNTLNSDLLSQFIVPTYYQSDVLWDKASIFLSQFHSI